MTSGKLHLKPPFRAEHIGSLVRPLPLFKKRELLEQNKGSSDDLTALEDEAIKRVVELQRELGIKTITDGELRR